MTKSLFKVALECATVVCVVYTVSSAIKFGLSRLPPISQGKCFSIDGARGAQLKVINNNIVEGYSDIEISVYSYTSSAKGSFDELRKLNAKETNCVQ